PPRWAAARAARAASPRDRRGRALPHRWRRARSRRHSRARGVGGRVCGRGPRVPRTPLHRLGREGRVRVALLSDVHANLVALEAVLAAVGPADALWVTGDAVMVQGNHDRGVATGEGLELFHERAAVAARMHAEWLSAEERDLLASLP